MNARSIILSTATGLVLMGLFVLYFKVRANPAVEVPAQALEEARQRHERAKTARSRLAARSAEATRAWTQPKSPRRRVPEPAPAEDAEPEPSPPPPDLDRRRPRPQFADMKGNPLQRGREHRERMNEVNKLYDNRDYEAAIAAAQEVLREMPRNVRMLRVVVSSACIMGDEGLAREHYAMLPPRDQRQMSVRCKRYGVEFEAPEAGDR